MARIRTIPKAVEEIKEKDPGTSVSLTALRRWVKEGKIRHFDGGKSPLVDLDEVERMVSGVPLRHLEKLAGLPGREVRRQIERERRAGALIISDNQHGYFLTDDPAEAQRFARSMQHRAREILRTAWAIEGAAGLD